MESAVQEMRIVASKKGNMRHRRFFKNLHLVEKKQEHLKSFALFWTKKVGRWDARDQQKHYVARYSKIRCLEKYAFNHFLRQ